MEAIMDKPKTQNVPTPMDDELLAKLDEMVEKKEQSRAGLIRLFVREKYEEFVREEAHKAELLSTVRKMKAMKS